VSFATSCPGAAADFNLALALLHSFEYDEAEKVFARILAENPNCALAYWGVAMSNFHPLWTPPSEAELRKGRRAIQFARALPPQSDREAAYLAAIAAYYQDWEQADHRTRCLRFEKAMEKLAADYPTDKDATVFYALALTAAADPADKTYHRQKKAGALLTSLYPAGPDHPGIIHYLIHAYDYPELAGLALPAARKYASVAPSSAHALHMPSHIFTRLGLWSECIQSNKASVSSARCYAEAAGMKGHWDEELHGLDYLMYAYLQEGNNQQATELRQYLTTIKEVSPVNFKVAYAYAAIPARYVLENRRWAEAAVLPVQPADLPWATFPWQKSIFHFTRLMGNVHLGKLPEAQAELDELVRLQAVLTGQKDAYKANLVGIQVGTGRAWLAFKRGNSAEALKLMQRAAELEAKTEKHPVTPGEVLPARELLADLLLALNQPAAAMAAYETSLKDHPNRFNGLYGAGRAAEKAGDRQKAGAYYGQLLRLAQTTPSPRPELAVAKQFLAR
jgi:tetratricopeptide (TPR) repeat protein